MPLDPSADYEFQDAVEIVFPRDSEGNEVAYRRWTGAVPLVYERQTYSPGGVLGRGDLRIGESLADATSVTLAVVSDVDRQLFLEGPEPGPAPARIIELWRKRPANGAWSDWTADGIYRGKLSAAQYADGGITIDIQRVFDDVWRGVPLRWTGTDQRRRYPGDSGLDRADRIRRSGLLVATT